MKWPVLVLAAALAGPPSQPPSFKGAEIPGVPGVCCGYADCRPASVKALGPKLALIDGVQVRLPAGWQHVKRSNKARNGWYCYKRSLDGCADGPPSERCARCAIEKLPTLAKSKGGYPVRMIPTGDHGYLLLEQGVPCGSCHGGPGG